ncbi:glycoside hydrolase family 23 protein [Sphaerobolus stellatus SS14]|nr:glycoside hydrolase family 23 protein [Sphaerobolus stellatus SS14]
MKPVVFVLLALSLFSNATFINHEQRAVHARSTHQKLAARASSNLTQNVNGKRCKTRPSPSEVGSSATSTPAPTPAAAAPVVSAVASSSAAAQPQSSSSSGSVSSPASGLLTVGSACGASGATSQITSSSGPNGNIDFLNCGINSGGWNPPNVQANQLITADFETALSSPGTPFGPCAPYWDLFRTYANQHGFSPLILASIAMQESTCNPGAVGGGGEQGLMQITKDKCGNAPGGNCQDPDYNIRTGAQFFADTLAGSGGNVIATLGKYNGWYTGLTYAAATAARYTSCCRCQNNLDYLLQTLNGWLQNINVATAGLSVYNNLGVC